MCLYGIDHTLGTPIYDAIESSLSRYNVEDLGEYPFPSISLALPLTTPTMARRPRYTTIQNGYLYKGDDYIRLTAFPFGFRILSLQVAFL